MTKNQQGFTLIEVMIAVVIIGILMAVAYPSYQAHIIESHRKEVQGTLEAMATAMERYRTDNNTYLGSRTASAAASAPITTVFPSQAPLDTGDKVYNLIIQDLSASSYTLRAAPIAGSVQDGNGYLELTSTGIKRWDKDDSGGIGGGETTWQD